MFRRPFLLTAAALAGLLLGGAATPARAAEASAEMRKEITKIALAIKEVLATEGQKTVSIGKISGTEAIASGAGPGMTQLLTEELTKAGVTVSPDAETVIQGEFAMTRAAQAGDELALRIQTELVDPNGKALAAFNLRANGKFGATVKSEEAVTAALGITGAVPADGTPAERAERIRENLANPPGQITGGTKFFADASSPYGIEIVSNGAPLPVSLENKVGQCDVPLKQSYMIQCYNNSEYDCAVRVAIDGLSIFHFSELRHTSGPKAGQPLYDSYVIPAKSFVQLKGWHKTNERVDSFVVDDLAKGASVLAKLQAAEGTVGMITAQFCAAWDINGSPPPDEPPAKKGTPRATGFGPPIGVAVKEVKRNIGVLRSTVALRYDK
ncbi:MAG: hypothetical protein IT428_22185 [Planctomycetaceae bacterium]|nr:hypothetical protein [Planctomycetaceae bacterium]